MPVNKICSQVLKLAEVLELPKQTTARYVAEGKEPSILSHYLELRDGQKPPRRIRITVTDIDPRKADRNRPSIEGEKEEAKKEV